MLQEEREPPDSATLAPVRQAINARRPDCRITPEKTDGVPKPQVFRAWFRPLRAPSAIQPSLQVLTEGAHDLSLNGAPRRKARSRPVPAERRGSRWPPRQ